MQNFAHQKLGRYLIVSEIAKGGMAQIYRAQLLGIAGFAKDVAIKKILPFWSANEEFIGMLIDEAKILVQLQHPNIVQVFELGKEHNAFFIVMEYVQGLDLRSLTKTLQEQQIKLPEALTTYIIKQICLGLDFAHHKTDNNQLPLHIVHRDISPQNILIGCEGEIKITDFGIAKTTQKTTHTQTGVLKGKFSYMSPEQALGEEIDQQTDIFALGLLFFELLHGQKCFDGKNDFEIIDKVKHAAIAIDPNLNPALQAILHKALATNKADRYKSALDFYHDLESWESSAGQKCVARDLKVFLKEHVPSIWQKNTAATPLQHSEDQTAAHLSTTPSPSYTIITQATTLWEKTQIQNTAKTRLLNILEKTKILFLPKTSAPDAVTEIAKTNVTVPVTKAKTSRFSRQSLLLLGVLASVLLWWTQNHFTQPAQPEIQASEASSQALNPDVSTLTTTSIMTSSNTTPALSADTNPASTTPSQPENITATELAAVPLPTKGNLSIKTDPSDAKIQIKTATETFSANGHFQKEIELNGEPQTFPVEVTRKNYKPQTVNLTLSQATPQIEQLITLQPLAFGKLTVDSRPWAQFTIEGFSTKNYSTPANVELPEGTYTLKLFSPSQKKSISKSIVIKPNTSAFCRATFAGKNSVACSYNP